MPKSVLGYELDKGSTSNWKLPLITVFFIKTGETGDIDMILLMHQFQGLAYRLVNTDFINIPLTYVSCFGIVEIEIE